MDIDKVIVEDNFCPIYPEMNLGENCARQAVVKSNRKIFFSVIDKEDIHWLFRDYFCWTTYVPFHVTTRDYYKEVLGQWLMNTP